MRINILDSTVFNKIAAGEVVEKPASIVKELVENSIDAESKNITIEIQNGGIDMIKVVDDGVGMDIEDLKRAFLPHATSKIKTVDDLAKIGTLGFRGEALASISAVSDVEIISNTENNDGGRISCIDTIISEPVEMVTARGTTIIVTDVFKNIPARRKFLRKPKSEESDITSYVEKLILANPHTAIKYVVNGKIVYNSTGNNLEEAIYIVYGKQVLDNLMEININYDDVVVTGYSSKPTFSKANRNYQTIICNGRYIQNQNISLAISNAYSQYMMKGQFPFYVLDLKVPLNSIDVNAHPNKLEVRFLNKQLIYSIFFNGIERAMTKARTVVNDNDFIPDDIKNTPLTGLTNDFIKSSSMEDITSIVVNKTDCIAKNDTEEKIKDKEPQKTDYTTDDEWEKEYEKLIKKSLNLNEISDSLEKKSNTDNSKGSVFRDSASGINLTQFSQNTNTSTYEEAVRYSSFSDGIKEVRKEAEKEVKKEIEKDEEQDDDGILAEFEKLREPELKIIGTCFDTYILIEKGDLYIIDQHAGHERLLYDELTKEIDSRKVSSQLLLFPYVFKVDTSEVEFVEDNIENLTEIGFEIERIGEKEFSISAVPHILSEINIKEFIDNLLSETGAILKLKSSDLVKEKLKMMSCRKAIKAGYKLTTGEIELLLNMTKDRNTPLMCPHGRPSVIKITKGDLEKWFKRAV